MSTPTLLLDCDGVLADTERDEREVLAKAQHLHRARVARHQLFTAIDHVDVALRGLFEQPTIAALAEMVTAAPAAARNDVPEIKPIPRGKKDMALLLSQIDQLTDEEVQALLARRAGKKN